MADDRSDVFRSLTTALSSGVRVLQDPFTYKAAGAALIPVTAALLLGFVIIGPSRFVSQDPLDALGDLLLLSLGWLLVVLVVVIAASLWFYIAVGMRTVTRENGEELATGNLLRAAAARILPVIGALLLLLLIGIGLFVVTWLLTQVSGFPVLSIIVALLTLPLLGAWVLLSVALLMGIAYMPAVAASKPEAGPGMILQRSSGIVLAYPAPALLMLVLAGITASITSLILYAGVGAGSAAGLGPIISEMAAENQSFALALTGLQLGVVILAIFIVPFAITAASISMFDRLIGDDPAVAAAPKRVLGLGWIRVRNAAQSTSSTVAKIRTRLDETAREVSEIADDTDDSQLQHPSPADDAEYCSACGASNPTSFRFCRSCGSPANT